MRGYEEREMRRLRQDVQRRDQTIAKLTGERDSYVRLVEISHDLLDKGNAELHELRQTVADHRQLDELYLRGILGRT